MRAWLQGGDVRSDVKLEHHCFTRMAMSATVMLRLREMNQAKLTRTAPALG